MGAAAISMGSPCRLIRSDVIESKILGMVAACPPHEISMGAEALSLCFGRQRCDSPRVSRSFTTRSFHPEVPTISEQVAVLEGSKQQESSNNGTTLIILC